MARVTWEQDSDNGATIYVDGEPRFIVMRQDQESFTRDDELALTAMCRGLDPLERMCDG